MSRQAVIVGGTGQIGRACAAALVRDGWNVMAVSREARELPAELAALGVEHRRADSGEPGALASVIGDGADVIVDVVAYGAEHAAQLLELRERVGSVVVISSTSVYTDDRGRTIDEATDPEPFPRLPVPIPETQRTVPPGLPHIRCARRRASRRCSVSASLRRSCGRARVAGVRLARSSTSHVPRDTLSRYA